ncbi:MAG: 50S ribosomal protein L32 [Patescibacteria group bacterium]|nr:50S ribosomal protein L32 [Patescibacteria group bacterium]MDD5715535.1 50S ribosomal protein L32 [Patescibacteria group bacterium]
MSVPSKRRTKQQKRERASHFALRKQTFAACPKCKKPFLSHRVCAFCGYYKGQDILLIDTKAERKKKKQKKKEDRAKSK